MSRNLELYSAFNERNFSKFIEELEVFETDPNFKIEAKDRTIFEHILSTPDSGAFIRVCLQHGADFNMVSRKCVKFTCRCHLMLIRKS